MGVATTPEFQADELAAWAAHAPLTDGILTPFGVIDAARLSQNGCIDALVGLERLKAWVEAQQVRIMAEADAHPDPIPPTTRHLSPQDVFEREQWAHESLTQEIACALRWAPGTAKSRIHVATVLVQRLSATLDTMETGTVSYLHARSLVETIRDLDPQTAAALEARVLPRAGKRTVGEFRADLRRGVAALDPRGEADKHEACAADRRVGYQPDEHAMAWLNAYLPAVDAETIMIVIQAVADLMHADDQRRVRSGELCEPRTADQLRADALTAICAAVLTGQPITGLGDGGVDEATLEMLHNLPRWQGRRPNVNVVAALSTMLGIDEQPGQLDGYGPIPADVVRRIAADPSATWHRLVTDDLGHLIDHGATKYRPPQDLIDFLTTRDRTCTGIGCHRHSRRSDIEHETDWAHGGPTNVDNLDPKCPRDHTLKHVAGWTPARQPDGTTRWTSPTGRAYEKPPDRYPTDRTRPKLEPDDNDPPPF